MKISKPQKNGAARQKICFAALCLLITNWKGSKMQNILFIGTDFVQYQRLKPTLTQFSCTYSVSLPEGVTQFNQREFCLIVLNLSLVPSNTGQEELLRSFRRAHPVPIIALCADVKDSDTVRLLDAGADQALSSQAPDEVLAAYARALIYRYTTLDRMDRDLKNSMELCTGDFKIELFRRQVFVKENRIDLSEKEYELLILFMQNPERVLSEEQICERLWNTEKEFHSGIAKPINRLRQKIEPDPRNPTYIRSVHDTSKDTK